MQGIYQKPMRKIAKYFMLIVIATLLPYQAVTASINTGLYGDDKYAGPFPIGFEFQYYDKTVTEFYATTNGLLQFSGPTTAYANTCLPGDFTNTLFVFWDDLRTDVSGQPAGLIQYEMQGKVPNRKLIVQWTNQYFYGSNLPMGTFQAILYEGSGEIKYQYRYLMDDRSRGNSATIGIRGPGSDSVQIGCNKADMIAPEQAILFTPNGKGSYHTNLQADYDFIDISSLKPTIPQAARYTNLAPQWHWDKVVDLNTYQIEIQSWSGEILLNQTLGDVDSFTYMNDIEQGKSYKARVRGSINNGGTWEVWTELSSATTVDVVAPVAVIHGFSRTGQGQVQVNYSANDDLSGVNSVRLQIATDSAFSQIVVDRQISASSTVYQVDGLPSSGALFARINATDNAGNVSSYSAAASIVSAVPQMIAPVQGAQVNRPVIDITAMTVANGNVQVYVDDLAVGSRLAADATGYFSTSITLNDEGAHRIALDVQSAYGLSEKSRPVELTYQATIPSALFVTPGEDITISAPLDIEVSAQDEVGIERVEIYVGDSLLTTMAEAPYRFHWAVDGLADGIYQIKAVATNLNGKSATTQRSVEVKLAPALSLTPYIALIDAIEPAVSYGNEPVVISGKAVERLTAQPMANTPLKLVLTVDGFKRQINLVTDANGAFSYQFIPQASDSGLYQVAVIHPKDEASPALGQFTISRIKFNAVNYPLLAAKDIPARVEVTASVQDDTQGLRWVMRASDQPQGQLPQGIKINSGNAVDINAGKSAAMIAEFIADETASETGTVVLTALAANSADKERGRMTVHYRLIPAESALYAQTPIIETGVRQGDMVTEEIVLGNRGLVSAKNVTLKLLDQNGNPPPAWLFLTGSELQGAVNVGDTLTLQLVAQPDDRVSDGIYSFNLQVNSDNGRGGNIPVSVSVLQSGEGTVRFDVADIYTATLDQNGLPILGLKGAKIKLQNEAVLTDLRTITTDDSGIAQVNGLAPGIYLYRASASQHIDTSGRIRIRPGVTSNQHIFLEYQTVNIEFSVTEKTIKDVYDIDVEATYNTQVPAPVVVFSPLSINLAGLQVGEERTGQLTLTNYGLVQADDVKFRLPQSDEQFKFEFFAEVPDVLAPKARIVIPYRVTALQPTVRENRSSNDVLARSTFSALNRATSGEQCSSYVREYSASYQYQCANGDITGGGGGGKFYTVTGGSCGDSEAHGPKGNSEKGRGGFNGATGSPSSMPMTLQCSKDCSFWQCCKPQGEKTGDQ